MTTEVPEIKLVKLLMISLLEKYTHDATLYWSDIYCLLQKGNPVTTKILFKLFSAGVKEKKQALFCFSTLFFISYKLRTTQSQISTQHIALPCDFQVGCATRFFKNASKKVVQEQGKKLVRSWEGAPKKMCFHSLKKKMEVESKKLKKMMIFDVLVPEMKN